MNHLDDEALSALLDGEGAADAHVRDCPVCQARSELLAAVARASAAPLPPASPATRDAHIRRAVSAAPLAQLRPTIRRRQFELGAAAAAIVLLLVGGGWLLTRGTTNPATRASAPAAATAGPSGASSPKPMFGSTSGSTSQTHSQAALAPANPLTTADLGDQSDLATLGAIVRANAGTSKTYASSSRLDMRDALACVTQQARPPPVASSSSAPAGPAIVYSAALRWRGVPAQLYAFGFAGPATPSSSPSINVEIVARSDCSLLAAFRA